MLRASILVWLQIWHAFLSVFQFSRSYRSVLFFRFVCSFTRGDTHSCCRLNFFYQGVSVCSDCVQCDWQPKTDDFLDKRRKPITWPHHASWARWRADPRNNSNGYQHAEHFKCIICRHRWLPMQCKLCASGGDEKRQQVCPFRSARSVKAFFLERELFVSIGLASDDVTKLSNAWQWGKLVLIKDSAPYKGMLGEKSLTGRSSLFLRGEVGTVLTTPPQLRASHFKDIGYRTSAGPFFGRLTISQHAFVWDAIFV